MNIRHVLLASIALLALFVATACGTAPTATPTASPTVVATATTMPTLPPPAPTVAPTAIPPTPLPPTATPIPPQATTKQEVIVRQGPGTQFTSAGKMPIKTSAVILGKSEDAKWLQVAFPDAAHPAWVSTAFVTVTGTIDQLPVVAVAAPATPTKGAVAVATKAPTAVPTQVVPAAKGLLDFVAFDAGQNSYVVKNLFINPRSFSDYKLIGPYPYDITQSTNAAPFAWSPDGSRVVYVLGQSRSAQNVLRMARVGTDVDIALVGSGGISSPTFSPDSQTVAYVGQDTGPQAIYTINPNGGPATRFFPKDGTRPPENFRGIAWGKTYMLFGSNESGSYEIWRANSDGSGAIQLTSDKRENGAPSWSPDNKQFAYFSKQADNSYQIMVANADGSGAKKLTNTANNFSPVWSPDGNWIAFSSTRNGRLDIFIMDKNGGNVQALTDKYSLESLLPGSWR